MFEPFVSLRDSARYLALANETVRGTLGVLLLNYCGAAACLSIGSVDHTVYIVQFIGRSRGGPKAGRQPLLPSSSATRGRVLPRGGYSRRLI